MSGGRKSRDKGFRFERNVVNWLRFNGFPHARRLLVGQTVGTAEPGQDCGDIDFDPRLAVQAKNCKDLARAMREGVDGAFEQATNRGARWGIAIISRPRKPSPDSYVVMSLRDWSDMWLELTKGDETCNTG